MGRYLTKMVFLVLTPIFVLHLLICSSSGAEVNSNENERFPLVSADLELKYLNLSQVFHEKKTCCFASQMQTASLDTYGEADKDCLELFELLESSICHSETPRVCASFCDRVFEACTDAYFSTNNGTKQIIVPCGENEDIICTKASKWESNGTAFCDDSTEEPCYGNNNASLEPVTDSSLIETGDSEFFETVLEKVMAFLTKKKEKESDGFCCINFGKRRIYLFQVEYASYVPGSKEHEFECLKESRRVFPKMKSF